jgi:hypothetical protein
MTTATENRFKQLIERGFLPGYTVKRSTSLVPLQERADANVPVDVLMQGGWLDVAKALARQVELGELKIAFAVLDKRGLWDSRGKFKQVNSPWDCFEYAIYLRVGYRIDGIGVSMYERDY